jgi:hypothetical protein
VGAGSGSGASVVVVVDDDVDVEGGVDDVGDGAVTEVAASSRRNTTATADAPPIPRTKPAATKV